MGDDEIVKIRTAKEPAMYPSTHLLTEALVNDRLREADHDRRASEALPRETAPRWWRLRASTVPAETSDVARIKEPRPVGLRRLETPTWSG
jgi:hypothetical protein